MYEKFREKYFRYIGFKEEWVNIAYINPSRQNPGRTEKNKLNSYFHASLLYLKRFYECLKGLHKTFWGTTKKCKSKNLTCRKREPTKLVVLRFNLVLKDSEVKLHYWHHKKMKLRGSLRRFGK